MQLSELPPDIWLRSVRVPAPLLAGAPAASGPDGLVDLDLRLTGGRIAAVAPAGAAPAGIDRDRGMAWPCFIDGHVHLDKTQIWSRQHGADGTHDGAIAAVRADRDAHWTEADIEARFDFGLRCAWAHGTSAIRTHIDSYWPHARNGWAVFRRMRDAWAGRIALQAVSLCPADRFAGDDGEALADEVARSGGLLGMSMMGPANQPALDRVFELAEARGLSLDLHLDETGDPASGALLAVAETALRRGFRRPIQVGHVCALAMQDEATALATIRRCAEAGIRVINLPMCNMYLQGRAPGRTPRWRGITLVHEFRAAGVPVSFASDNCRDPFYAYGDYDMLEVYREAVRIAQLDHPFADWAGSVAAVPAASCGFADHGTIRVGATADLVLFGARTMTELLARPHSDRTVVRAGRVVAESPPDFRELDAVLGAV
jgi:cytosine deaminase